MRRDRARRFARLRRSLAVKFGGETARSEDSAASCSRIPNGCTASSAACARSPRSTPLVDCPWRRQGNRRRAEGGGHREAAGRRAAHHRRRDAGGRRVGPGGTRQHALRGRADHGGRRGGRADRRGRLVRMSDVGAAPSNGRWPRRRRSARSAFRRRTPTCGVLDDAARRRLRAGAGLHRPRTRWTAAERQRRHVCQPSGGAAASARRLVIAGTTPGVLGVDGATIAELDSASMARLLADGRSRRGWWPSCGRAKTRSRAA